MDLNSTFAKMCLGTSIVVSSFTLETKLDSKIYFSVFPELIVGVLQTVAVQTEGIGSDYVCSEMLEDVFNVHWILNDGAVIKKFFQPSVTTS